MFKLKTVTHITFVVFIYICISLVLLPESQAAENPKNFAFEELNPALSLLDSVNDDYRNNGSSATRRIKASIRKNLQKKTFRADEAIAVSFNNPGGDTLQIQITDKDNKPIEASLDNITENGVTTLSVNTTNAVKPGKYKLIVTGMEGKMLEQDFTWGVLAINTNKSYYHSGDKAHLEFAVLNDLGNMVCDAKLVLQIKNYELGINDTLTTEAGDIVTNPSCYSHEFTLQPDYESEYTVGGEGIYQMILSAETSKGSYTINDAFIVDDNVSFDVERITATRIFPANNYPVIFKITANEDFEGIMREALPGNFSSTPISVSTKDITADTYESEITIAEPIKETLKPSESDTPGIQADKNASISALTSSSSGTTDPEVHAVKIVTELEKMAKGQKITISLQMPFEGKYPITQHFGGANTDPLLLTQYIRYGVLGHDGMDFALPRGTPVLAADEGTIIYADTGDYGKTVIVQHAWGRSYYGHLDDIAVRVGELVIKGNRLGLSGNTGLSTGPHLHFGIKPDDNNEHNGYYGKVDPEIYLNTTVTTLASEATIKADILENPVQVTSIDYPLTLKKGESIQVEYKYLAPQKSPEAYLLGPLQLIHKDKGVVFEEARQWQIASDASWVTGPWLYRKLITIDNADVSNADSADFSNFPWLINIASDTDLAARAQDNAFDIMFTSSGGTAKIPAEIVTFDGSSGALVAWVSIPTLDWDNDTLIYMYYGNAASCNQELSSCSDYDSTKNMNTTWTNASYVAVWHMEEVPTTQQTDSTGNGFTLTYNGGIASGQSVTAKVSKGIDLDGTNDYMTRADSASFDPASTYTYSAWLRVDAFRSDDNYWLMHNQDPCCPDYSYRHYYEGTTGDDGRFSWNWYNGTTEYYANGLDSSSAGHVLLSGTFGYVSQVKLSTSFKFYFNGADISSGGNPTTSGSLFNANNILCIASNCTPVSSDNWINGVIDELFFANTTRTAGWVATEYTNQNNPSSTYTVGIQECTPFPDTSIEMRHGKYFTVCGEGAFSW